MSDTVFEAWTSERPAPGLGRRLAGHALRLALLVCGLAAATALATTAYRRLPIAAPALPLSPLPAWRDIIKPVQIYTLEAPDFAGVPTAYTARRHTTGGGREDVIALGMLDGDKPSIRLRIFRRAEEAPVKVPLFAALAHEAAEVGLAIARSGLPDVLPTRFGAFEVVDIALARRDGVEAPCDGFRLMLDKPAWSITGLACGRHAAPLTRAEIGCLVERLDVASARDDRDLIDVFAQSELRRNASCVGMRLSPDGLHAPWLDDKSSSASAKPKEYGGDKPATTRKRLRRR